MAATFNSNSSKNVRLNKYLADRGYCSRREADRLIQEGQVRVNSKIAGLGTLVGETDTVSVQGKDLPRQRKKPIFLLYYKPIGVECTLNPKVPNSLGQIIDYPERIFMIGRLDKMSEGLLLLTNFGESVNKILRSENQKEKEYLVTLTQPIQDRHIQALSEGVTLEIDGKKIRTKKCQIERLKENRIRIILTEGKNRQIRRMLEKFDYKIKRLKRVRVMNLNLGKLEPGEYRELSPKEIQKLLKQLDLQVPEF